MTYFNFIPQFNTNIWSGFSNMFSPQWSFMSFPPLFNNFGVNFNNFTMPSFNWSNSWNNFNFTMPVNNVWNNYTMPINWNNGFDTFTKTTSSNLNSNLSISTETKCTDLISMGYNAQKGQRLAKTALNRATGFGGNCAKYVKKAIQSSGLGEYKAGHAYQMTSILSKNSHFKQISPNSVNVNDLPAGCILVFNKGAQGYSKTYGHVEITTGTGKAVSDGITKDLQKPSAIFIPV